MTLPWNSVDIKIGRGVNDLKDGFNAEVEDLRQKEQAVVDRRIVHGKEPGYYFLLIGSKVRLNPRLHACRQPRLTPPRQGTGKASGLKKTLHFRPFKRVDKTSKDS